MRHHVAHIWPACVATPVATVALQSQCPSVVSLSRWTSSLSLLDRNEKHYAPFNSASVSQCTRSICAAATRCCLFVSLFTWFSLALLLSSVSLTSFTLQIISSSMGGIISGSSNGGWNSSKRIFGTDAQSTDALTMICWRCNTSCACIHFGIDHSPFLWAHSGWNRMCPARY